MDYLKKQTSATKSITKFGNGLNAELNYLDTGAKQKISCVVVSSDESYLEGSVHRKAKRVLVSGALKTAPRANDFIVMAKQTFTIREVEDLTPDGKTTIMFKLLVS